MRHLKQSVATAVLIGPFLDETDGRTPETALSVVSIDADLYKASDTHPLTKTDLTLTASGGSNDCAHVANGYYSLELTAGNVDTLGRLRVTFNITGALPIYEEFEVLTANAYDTLYGADAWNVETALLQTQAKADVNAEVVDAVSVDTIAELSQGIPPVTPTMRQALMLLYMALSKKTVTTSSEFAVFNDANTKIAKQTLTDDGNTLTIEKMVSGA